MPDPVPPADNSPEEFEDPLENFDPKTYDDPLEKALAEQSVSAINSHPYARISPDATVYEALQKLGELQHACLLVEENESLVGVFSDRDVLKKVALEFDEVKDRPVRDFMTTDPVVVYETDSSAAALTVMAVLGFRHVPVLDLDDKIVGIISPQRVTEFLMANFKGD